MSWRNENDRHRLARYGIKTQFKGRGVMADEKPYPKDPSIMKSRRNIHRLVPVFDNVKEFDEYAMEQYPLIYEQVFCFYKHSLKKDSNVPIQTFYWRKTFDGKWELLFKKDSVIYEIENPEQFKKYADGEKRKMR